MTLIEEAARAEDIGNALAQYRKPNPEYVQNINATISQLVSLGSALREIARLLEDHSQNLSLVEDDLKLVHECVSFTLADIWHIIGTIGERPDSPLVPEDFRKNWRKIIKYGRDRDKKDLSARLDKYKGFLFALCKTIQNQTPSYDDIGALRIAIGENAPAGVRRALEQSKQISGPGNALTAPAASSLMTKRSYERQRDRVPISPSEAEAAPLPFMIPPYDDASPPTSPTNTYSTASQVSGIESDTEHWALRVFKEVPSWTPLPSSNDRSEYHDSTAHPRYELPSESHVEVVALSFPPDPPGLIVSLYCRPRDWRAKMVVQCKDHRGKLRKSCLPLNMLKVCRRGPLLVFCRQLPNGSLLAWLTTKFTTVERLILFACTFLSMRAHDGRKPERPVDDWEFEGEEIEYAGKIQDNGFSHALRIYRDKASNAVRLQASVYGGQLDKWVWYVRARVSKADASNSTPVWSAFVTHYIASRTWCQRLERNSVCLRELRPHNFSSNYELTRLPNGAFVLNFGSRGDAKDFMGCIEELGRDLARTRM